jgi:cytochrome c oxidase subunit II
LPLTIKEREGALSLAGTVKAKAQHMIFGEHARAAGHLIKAAALSLLLLAAPQVAMAQAGEPGQAVAPPVTSPVGPEAAGATAAPVATPPATPVPAVPPAPASVTAAQQAAADPVAADPAHFAVAPGGYTPMKPTPGIGMPVDGGIGLQQQFSPTGHYARWLHDWPLMIIVVVMSVFVLVLLLYVVVRFNKRANPVPSKTSHNTLIEIAWTLIPVLILVGIAVPSMDLLAQQFKPAPAKALTIKATGNQWFWTYSYPDNGGFEVVSNMLKDKGDPSLKAGDRFRTEDDGPEQLAADFRMVVPVGEPIRLQVTASDVIHAFAVPSLWYKIDAVPGRINEKVLFVEKPGVYFGQCSELCGVRHGYMPIVVEALPRAQYNAWVLSQSDGKIDGMPEPAAAPVPAAAAPAPAASASPAPAAATPPAPAA